MTPVGSTVEPGAAPADLPWGTRIVAGAFLLSGTLHLAKPPVFAGLIPRRLGAPTPWVITSGIAELVCAGGLITRQRWAPAATAATLTVIWVGNAEMALRLQRNPETPASWRIGGWARLPLQIPLIYWAWRSPTRNVAPSDGAVAGA